VRRYQAGKFQPGVTGSIRKPQGQPGLSQTSLEGKDAKRRIAASRHQSAGNNRLPPNSKIQIPVVILSEQYANPHSEKGVKPQSLPMPHLLRCAPTNGKSFLSLPYSSLYRLSRPRRAWGWAPTISSTFSPSLKMMKVGMERMPSS
jgi:hypothetical protein